jgi:hypothetical protein
MEVGNTPPPHQKNSYIQYIMTTLGFLLHLHFLHDGKASLVGPPSVH